MRRRYTARKRTRAPDKTPLDRVAQKRRESRRLTGVKDGEWLLMRASHRYDTWLACRRLALDG